MAVGADRPDPRRIGADCRENRLSLIEATGSTVVRGVQHRLANRIVVGKLQ